VLSYRSCEWTINSRAAAVDTADQGSLPFAALEAAMSPSDDDRLIAPGDLPVFTGMWSLVALVILVTAACM